MLTAARPGRGAARTCLVVGAIAGSVLGLPAAAGASAEAGDVRLAKAAGRPLDHFTASPSRSEINWMRANYWRMQVFSPYFDARLAWSPPAWAYHSLYAIYRGSALARRHPKWILRDGRGRKLYLSFHCAKGACTQYAADITNPAFRRHWIRQARGLLLTGYRGVYIDDMNINRSVFDGYGKEVVPRSAASGRKITKARWARTVASFAWQIRRALPDAEVVHNTVWFARPWKQVKKQIAAASYVQLERGLNDAGLTGGTTQWSLHRFLRYVDRVHALGKPIVFAPNHRVSRAQREYGLAGYFLVNNGLDAIDNLTGATMRDYWAGYDVSLGTPLGPRYRFQRTMFRRDFERGMVLVNEPQARTRTVALGRELRTIGGRLVSTVRLGPAGGVVLRTP